jgi:hypothetical protein
MSQSMKVLYALGLILLFVAGLMLAKYNPWTEQNNANLGYANLGGDFVLEVVLDRSSCKIFAARWCSCILALLHVQRYAPLPCLLWRLACVS